MTERLVCGSCGNDYDDNDLKTVWDETGYGYSTKLTICPICGAVVDILYVEDKGLDVNNDARWYEYDSR